MCREIIRDFDHIETVPGLVKPRVGIVGEILVKFHPAANNNLAKLLEQEGAEANVPDLMGFMLYCFYNQVYKAENLGTSKKTALLCTAGIRAIEAFLRPINKAYKKSVHFDPPASIYQLVKYAEPIVSIGNETGEGWFLTGEMIELIHSGVENIVCIQPFGCLPNHVVGKGVIKHIRSLYPMANIAAIDYDPGASEVNQLNRIKLMLATAGKNAARKAALSEEDSDLDYGPSYSSASCPAPADDPDAGAGRSRKGRTERKAAGREKKRSARDKKTGWFFRK